MNGVLYPTSGNKRKRSTDECEPPSKRPRTGSSEEADKVLTGLDKQKYSA